MVMMSFVLIIIADRAEAVTAARGIDAGRLR